jgi:hypothetical protein
MDFIQATLDARFEADARVFLRAAPAVKLQHGRR